ncbi:Hypothetical predicted protein [Mytilus galloprovincialis]|uniref:F5/8 type C domain-containing protein n=1 Tax=Mytilus galloprovincialis TaxID=29158 RepID=A0A8B6BT10_MYTGA|nr:Hypothetical predicted protein [Mytilus galloprovincialis]
MDYICCNSTYAVDGDKTSLSPRYPSGDFFCTHSDSLAYQQSWWAVDLQEVYVIIGVDIFGRTDCCTDQLANFDVEVFMPTCTSNNWNYVEDGCKINCHYQAAASQRITVSCPSNTKGRYIRIRRRDTSYLVICEVEVYGNRIINFHKSGKGMKFIPNPKRNNIRKQILMDFNELTRKMRCKFHYSGKNNNKHIHPLYLQSGHIPPRGNVALENYLIDTKLELSKLEVKQFRDNLSKLERKALIELKHNDSIYVSKADKNNTTVIVNKIDYIKAGTSHLNSNHYLKINEPTTNVVVKSIKDIVENLYRKTEIDSQTYNFLKSNNESKHGHMYLLPKIHKLNLEIINEAFRDGQIVGNINIPYRPIINKCNSPTRGIERLLNLI